MDYESNKFGDAPTIDQSIEKKQISDQLPPLSANYSWLVSQNLDDKDDNDIQSFYATHDPLLHYHCKIPELLGRRIRGCFFGWLILSNHPQNVMWSLWNPLTSKLIRLPPFVHINGDFDDIKYCCLSSPPDHPNSVLLLTRFQKPNIVFFRLDQKRKRSKWIEMSYARQLQNKDDIIYGPACCNGKVYALTLKTDMVVQVDIVLNDKEVVITLLPSRVYPSPSFNSGSYIVCYLKGFGTELICIIVGSDAVATNTLSAVYLYKLDMTSISSMWVEIKDLKDTVFFVDHACDNFSVFYNTEIPTRFGGYVHIRGNQNGSMIHSYHVKDKTVSLTPMACLFLKRHVSLWECRLEGDDGEGKGKVDYKQEENEIAIRSIRDHDDFEYNNMTNESQLLDIPLHFLEKLMEFCVGIEYLKFRATCKRCRLAAPMIQWRNEAALKKTKLQTYSLVSPWLMVLEDNRGTMSFIDPVFGDKYFIKTLPVSILNNKLIVCSRYGWLLFYCDLGHLEFFNPFTSDLRNLPITPAYLINICFSAPPTSTDCLVVGFSERDVGCAYILCLADQNPLWRRLINLSFGDGAPYTFCFTTFFGRDLYGLCKEGKLFVFKMTSGQNFTLKFVVAKAPKPRWDYLIRHFLVKRDEHVLLVRMEEFGHYVELFQLNDSTKEWMKVDCLGRHAIYISGATCVCIEDKTLKMQNKIFFPRLHCEDGKIVFYSVKTGGYHTFDSKRASYDCLIGTKYLLYPHAWIEPSWYL